MAELEPTTLRAEGKVASWWFTGADTDATILTRLAHALDIGDDLREEALTQTGSPLHNLYADIRILQGKSGMADLKGFFPLAYAARVAVEHLADGKPLSMMGIAMMAEEVRKWEVRSRTGTGRVLCLSVPDRAEYERLVKIAVDLWDGEDRHKLFPFSTRGLINEAAEGSRFVNVAVLPDGYTIDPHRLSWRQDWISHRIPDEGYALSREVLDAVTLGVTFFRCTECGRPVPKTRDWQLYCTERCAARARMRNMRARRREQEKEGDKKSRAV